MSGLGKRGPAGGVIGALQGGLGGERVFTADMLEVPKTGWPVSADAPLVSDVQSSTSIARSFGADQDRGVGLSLRVPSEAVSLLLRLPGRVAANPPAEVAVLLRIYARKDEGAWSGPQAAALLRLPNNLPQSAAVAVLLAPLGIVPGDNAQFLLVRAPGAASDTLEGGWNLYEVGVNFA